MLAIIMAAAALPSLTGDFDGDGRRDTASIVRIGMQYRLIVRRAADPRHAVNAVTLGTSRGDFFLSRAAAGKWRTWCGKGGGDQTDTSPCHRKSVTLHGGELIYGYREASASVLLWNGRRFEDVLISD